MSSYHELLKAPEWQSLRQKVFARDGYQCQLCGAKDNLNAHHTTYGPKGSPPWSVGPKWIETLCEHCHEWFHADLVPIISLTPDTSGGYPARAAELVFELLKCIPRADELYETDIAVARMKLKVVKKHIEEIQQEIEMRKFMMRHPENRVSSDV